MAKVNFTEARVRDLKQSDKITWYSHKGDLYPGLHLAVGQATKTFYLKKRNPVTGKTQTINLGRFPAMSLELAGRRAKEISAEVHNGTRGTTQMETLADAFEYHCKTKRSAKKLSEETERSYRSIMKNMDDFMGRKLENISHVALQEHLGAMTAPTARLIRAIVGASYRAARKQRPTLINPAEGIELESPRKREVVTEDVKVVWEAILKVSSETRRMAWVVALFSGIRHKSVVTLRWDEDPMGVAGHVDLDAKTIHLPKMKNQLARTLPISEVVVAALKRQVGKDTIFVFPSEVKVGIPLYSMGRLDVSIAHDLRHHFSTAAGKAKLPSYIIAFLRGDKITADNHKMVAHYLGAVGSNADAEEISKVILRDCGVPPASAIELISEG